MNSTKRALRYKFKNTGKSIIKFWIVLLIVDFVAIFLNLKYGNQNTFYLGFTNIIEGETFYSLFGVNILPILIYFIVTSYSNYYEDFSRLLNFSITRNTIIKVNLISNVAIAFIFALIQSTLMKIDPLVMTYVDKKPLYEFFIFNTQRDSIIFIAAVFLITFLVFISLWGLIASLNYKYGPKIWILFLIIFAVGNNIIINSFSLFNIILPGNWLNMAIDINRLLVYMGFIIFAQGATYLISRTTD